jgi:murein DD-endopeptidase MepM/ murein hydrolase activator NlpD
VPIGSPRVTWRGARVTRARATILLLLAALLLHGCGSPTGLESEDCTGYPPWQTSGFVLPYPVGTAYELAQGNCSGAGHSGAYKYSYDFAMAIGTPVTAAADGTVYQIRSGYPDGDIMPGHENFVKLIHADGLISAYSHLSRVLVVEGATVRSGDVVGLSGNTGNTGNFPHLHFHVSTCSEPVDCGTLPATFRNTNANPQGLQPGRVYPALPY